jgi:hypothetical protein
MLSFESFNYNQQDESYEDFSFVGSYDTAS